MKNNKQSGLKIRSLADKTPMPDVNWPMPKKYGADEPNPRLPKANKAKKK